MALKIGKKSQIPPGKSISIDLPDGRVIALFNVAGEFFALNNLCPHQGGPLAEGKIVEGHVTCPWHDWTFDIRSGVCINKPCERAKCYQLEIKDDDIFLTSS
jgi:nitrite reductase/ring-hydroxylating ferredoxin subunit